MTSSASSASSYAIYPSLAGKRVVITGGASGIGAALVEHFVAQKSRVLFFDLARAEGEKLAQATGATFYCLDLRNLTEFQTALAKHGESWGGIDVLVNNAARDDRHDWRETTPDYFDQCMAVNLKHQYFAIQSCAKQMSAGGSIINMGSTSWIVGARDLTIYGMAKSAVIGLTRLMARELGEAGIRVNCVQPGWTMTERQIKLWLTPEGEEQIMRSQCLKRKLYAPDVARMVLWLAAEDSSMVTQQVFTVDGGWV
ncbi:MAG TPA: SDR family oxidoreductase [Dongiaceae bacterium]|jgi:NAD(P)-dependent dehydrogenase (short-subunit alcohol dehydrogenase family)|nr:SDR family oxidoreductase [Dongiaceae bacterium]